MSRARTEISPTVDHPVSLHSLRPWWIWLVTAAAFPLSGAIAHGIAGPVNSVSSTLLGGFVAGAGIGTLQWVLLRSRRVGLRWIPATAIGLAVGIAVGAELVSYRTDISSLALMGAFSGLGIGLAQGAVLGRAMPALLWGVATAALWAIGWSVTTAIGVDVDEQWVNFGAAGCLTLAFLQSFIIRPFILAGTAGVMTANTHLVFGTGQAGTAVARALLDQDAVVRMVNRSGRPTIAGVETIGGDATDTTFTEAIATATSTIYFCLNAPTYDRWPEEFPPLQRGVLRAAISSGARLVALENLYMYGPTRGPMSESTPVHTTSAKARTRADMSAELLAAHVRGDAQVTIGRASDFVGPGVRNSALGEFVFGPALKGKRAQTMGRLDAPHTYSYIPDIGRNLALLGSHDDAYGHAWHLPNPETRTTRQVITDVYAAAGSSRTTITALKGPMLRAVGLFNANLRELRHTYYQFDAPFVVDDSAFRAAFGGHTTDWDDIIATTLDWYRAAESSAERPLTKDGVMNRKLTAIALITAAVLTNAGFTALNSVFKYPDVLKESTDVVLERFRDNQSSVTTWFAVLTFSAALFALIAIGVGKLRSDSAMRLAVPIGIAAAVVQAVGLSRWFLLVPGFSSDAASANAATAADARDHFDTANTLLGTVLGETLGYTLTAVWTLLVVRSLGKRFAGRGFTTVGTVTAAMIFLGVLSPLELDVIDTVNFVGYILWSVWLVWMAVVLLKGERSPGPEPARADSPIEEPLLT